ncbi:hypothetical protein [Vibrio alginolyticus]|nr:hypothetical protein [Vibrio alginolyticus]
MTRISLGVKLGVLRAEIASASRLLKLLSGMGYRIAGGFAQA